MIHRFSIDTGDVQQEMFDAAVVDFRSDVEQRHTQLALHDVDAPEVLLARKMADEIIHISGAEVKVYVRTENADYDAVWDEDPDPTYWDCRPLKAFFKPAPLEAELKKWGVDTANRTEVTFSHRQIFNEYGERMLRAGDVIQLPYNAATPAVAPRNYRVLNAAPSGNFRYVWLYLTCAVELLTADITVRPPDDIMPEDEPIPTGGVYRETA